MDSSIKIYTTPWYDISKFKKLFHTHLLKYQVHEFNPKLFGNLPAELPLIAVHDKLFCNPDIDELKSFLGLRDELAQECYEAISIGSQFENYAFLDYALKHSIDAAGCGKNIVAKKREFDVIYDSMFKQPNPFMHQAFLTSTPITVEQAKNRMYYRLVFKNKAVYTRSIFSVFDTTPVELQVPGEKREMGKHIANGTKDFMAMLWRKRVRTPAKRIFAIAGDHPSIVAHAFELYDQLLDLTRSRKFELIVLSSEYAGFLDPYVEQALRRRSTRKTKIRIIPEVHINEIRNKDFRLQIYTNMRMYDVNYLCVDNKPTVNNAYMQQLFDFNRDGLLDADPKGKTRYSAIYTMKPEKIDFALPARTVMLDKYVACANIVKEIDSYLNRYI